MLPRGGVLPPGGCVLPPGGGVLPPIGVPGGDPPPGTATAAGGTHPTGMHSCFFFKITSFSSDVLYFHGHYFSKKVLSLIFLLQ